MPIRHVSDTAYWVAMYRAIESERPDALFHDPHARLMAGEQGESIAREVPLGAPLAWALSVRTASFDALILDCIGHGATSVLNLGAGLDTRAFRLALPPSLRWLDVDLPGIVAHRHACLDRIAPVCEHRHLAADVNDAQAMQAVLALAGQGGGPLLVVSEGLLPYLEPGDVGRLARRLHAQADARWWLTDLISPQLLRVVGPAWPSNEAATSAPFRFAPENSAAFFEPFGWREQVFRSTWDEAMRLNRAPPVARWWSTFGLPWWPGMQETVRRMSGVALLQAAATIEP